MTRVLLLLLVLAGCGVDGPPLPPEPEERARPAGIAMSGSAELGVAGGF